MQDFNLEHIRNRYQNKRQYQVVVLFVNNENRARNFAMVSYISITSDDDVNVFAILDMT